MHACKTGGTRTRRHCTHTWLVLSSSPSPTTIPSPFFAVSLSLSLPLFFSLFLFFPPFFVYLSHLSSQMKSQSRKASNGPRLENRNRRNDTKGQSSRSPQTVYAIRDGKVDNWTEKSAFRREKKKERESKRKKLEFCAKYKTPVFPFAFGNWLNIA